MYIIMYMNVVKEKQIDSLWLYSDLGMKLANCTCEVPQFNNFEKDTCFTIKV